MRKKEKRYGAVGRMPCSDDEGSTINLGRVQDVDDLIEVIGIGRYHYVWMVLLGMSGMAQACESTLASVIVDQMACQWSLTLLQRVIIPGSVLLCGIFGELLGGIMADRYGRKKVLIIGQVLLAIFAILSVVMPEYWSFIVTRAAVGFGIGVITNLSLVQVMEITPTRTRFTATCINFGMYTVGNCFVVTGAYIFHEASWRWVVLWTAIPCIILCFTLPFMDESPKYLIVTNQRTRAIEVVQKMALWNRVDLDISLYSLKCKNVQERGRVSEMFHPNQRFMTIILLLGNFLTGLIYIGSIYITPNLLNAYYCFDYTDNWVWRNTHRNISGSVNTCKLEVDSLFSSVIITLSEFLSLPVLGMLNHFYGRIKTGITISFATFVATGVLLGCAGPTVLRLELFIWRCFTNAMELFYWIYTPENYPTYMRSVSFGVALVAFNLGSIAAMVNVYVVGLAYSWRCLVVVATITGLLAGLVACNFRKETANSRLDDFKAEDETDKLLSKSTH